MCISVYCDGRLYGTPRELAELVGGLDNMVYEDYCGGLPWGDVYMWDAGADWCLCSVDIPATLAAVGLTVTPEDFDPMMYRVVPPLPARQDTEERT